ncbi:MAG TPA: CBS domain-containing protein [Candidatus Obscuribacterales bacterium]
MALIDESLDADDLTDYYYDRNDEVFTAISSETVRSLKPVTPITLDPNDTVAEAIGIMQSKRIGALVVLENQRPVGIFTERDVLAKVVGKVSDLSAALLKDYMTANPICLRIDDHIAYALNQMTVGGFRHIPIIDLEGHVTGIISIRDIAEFLANLVPEEVYNIRPTPLRGGFMSEDGG